MVAEVLVEDTCGFSDRGSALARRARRTLAFGPQQVEFFKLGAVPTLQRGRPPWDRVRQLAVGEPALREWQRASPAEATR